MKWLWTRLETKTWSVSAKTKIMLLICSLVYALIGLALWALIRLAAFDSAQWAFCFAGYPVLISWVVVFLYTANHEFTNHR